MEYPSDIDLAGYLAVPVLGWFTVRWYSEKNVYVGRRQPTSKADSIVPGIHEERYYTRIISHLQVWERYVVRTTRQRTANGKQVVNASLERDSHVVHEATGNSREQAVARAAWMAIDADEQAAWE